jgi:hypothetical protein
VAGRWGYTGRWTPVTDLLDPSVDYRAADLPVGVYLSVAYRGTDHRCFVVPPFPDNDKGYWRYVYRGERYRTLSAVARVITGDRTLSGNRFFRLRRRRRG